MAKGKKKKKAPKGRHAPPYMWTTKDFTGIFEVSLSEQCYDEKILGKHRDDIPRELRPLWAEITKKAIEDPFLVVEEIASGNVVFEISHFSDIIGYERLIARVPIGVDTNPCKVLSSFITDKWTVSIPNRYATIIDRRKKKFAEIRKKKRKRKR